MWSFQGCAGATAAGSNVIGYSANGTYWASDQSSDVVAGRSLQVSGTGRRIVIGCTANFFEAEADAVLAIDTLTLSGCTGSGGAIAINAKNADLTPRNLVVRDFTSTTSVNGGAVAVTGGSLTIRNVQMCNNCIGDGNASTSGVSGALSISNVSLVGTVEVSDCVFANNRADKNGGAVHINSSPTLGHGIRFSDVTIESNQAHGDQAPDGGGALWIQTGDDEVHDLITDSLFRSDVAERALGGAIVPIASRLVYGSADASNVGGVFSSHFQGNLARGGTANDGSGGGIFTRCA